MIAVHDVPRLNGPYLFLGGPMHNDVKDVDNLMLGKTVYIPYPVDLPNECRTDPEIYYSRRLSTIFNTTVQVLLHSSLGTVENLKALLKDSRFAVAFGL